MTSLLVSLGYPILVEDYIDSSAFRWSSFPPNNAGPHLPIPPFSFSSRHCYISPSDPPTNIMVGQGKRPYAVDKLYQNNLDQNVNGRKQVPGADYTIRTIPKRLQDRFSSKLASKKKSAPVPPAPHATDARQRLSQDVNNKCNVAPRHLTPANNGWLLLAYLLQRSLILLSEGGGHDAEIWIFSIWLF